MAAGPCEPPQRLAKRSSSNTPASAPIARSLASFRHGRPHGQAFCNQGVANINTVSLNKTVARHHLQARHSCLAESHFLGAGNQRLQTRARPGAEFTLASTSRRLARRVQLVQGDEMTIDPYMFGIDNFRRIAARYAHKRQPKRQ